MRPKMDAELIYSTALKYFAKYGYKKTTIEDIAKGLNMSNSNIYSYASSKQALYLDCIMFAISNWQSYVRQAVEKETTPSDRLFKSFFAAVDFMEENIDVQLLFKNDPTILQMFPDVDLLEEFNTRTVHYLKGLIDDGIKAGDFKNVDSEVTAKVFFDLYKYFIISTYVREDSPGDLDVHGATVVDVILNGLAKKD